VNKYLVKIAEQVAESNQPSPLKTTIQQGVASVIPDLAGGAIGGAIGKHFKIPHLNLGFLGSHNTGGLIGAGIGGSLASYAVLKHQQLQREGQKQ
jgi:hypothetical protein